MSTETKTTTTLDFKTLLKNWKLYQNSKLIMAEEFNCNIFMDHNNVTLRYQGTLVFLSEQNSLEVRAVLSGYPFIIKIKSEDINGFNPDGNTIKLVMKPDLGKQNIVVEFATGHIHAAVLTKLENWSGPTPPSPDSSLESD